ncbi:N-acetyltransferase [Prosthecochloris sp.]|uniref:GNAT family N-acetyltransferase n=1 Tax=Prosthecochloris sp. TaxID=290513 RepID=UPI00257BC0D8|nr:N-acetyltransferase [Prosthecochloris sp.]
MAVNQDTVIGHILFTPVTIDGSKVIGMGLGSDGGLPSCQKQGIGSMLVRHGLRHLRQSGCPFVIVWGILNIVRVLVLSSKLKCQWKGVPDEVFMGFIFDNRDA